MAFVVRELIAVFAASVDNASFNALEHRIAGLKHAIAGVAAGFLAHDLYEMGEKAARFEDARAVFVQAGGDIEKLRVQTRGLVNDFDLVKSFNFAQQFGLGAHLGDFFKIANAASKKFGMDKEQALRQVLYGVALHSGSRLKTVGINVVGQKKRIEDEYAKAHGLNAKMLTQAQVMEAYAQEAIKQGAQMIKQVGDAGDLASDRFQRAAATIKNTKLALGELVDVALVPLLDYLIPVVRGLRDFFDVLHDPDSAGPDAVETWGELADALRTVGVFITSTWRTMKGLFTSRFGKSMAELALAVVGMNLALRAGAGPLKNMRDIAMGSTNVLNALSKAFLLEGEMAAGAAAMNALWAAGLLGMLAILYVIGEEIAAIFDPDVDGLFETWSGHWEEFTRIVIDSEDPSDSPFLKGLKTSLQAIAFIADSVERAMSTVSQMLDDWSTGSTLKALSYLIPGGSTLFDAADRFGNFMREGDYSVDRFNASERRRLAGEMARRQAEYERSRGIGPRGDIADFGSGMSMLPTGPEAPAPLGEGYGVLTDNRPNVTINTTLAVPYDQPTIEQTMRRVAEEAVQMSLVDGAAGTGGGAR